MGNCNCGSRTINNCDITEGIYIDVNEDRCATSIRTIDCCIDSFIIQEPTIEVGRNILTIYDKRNRIYLSALAYIDYADRGRVKSIHGADCTKLEKNIMLLNKLIKIMCSYMTQDVGLANCLTEAQMDDVYELFSKITGLCYPPKGITVNDCYIALESDLLYDIIISEVDGFDLLPEQCK